MSKSSTNTTTAQPVKADVYARIVSVWPRHLEPG